MSPDSFLQGILHYLRVLQIFSNRPLWKEPALLRIEAIGHAEAARGHALTAAAYLRRAANYYQIGERFAHPKSEASQSAYMRAVQAFRKAAGLMTRPRIEHVEVPYEGTSLPGMIVHADPIHGAGGRGPVMLFLDGFDVTKEIQYFRGIPDLAARGVSCLLLDGPGNGESIRFRNLKLRVLPAN